MPAILHDNIFTFSDLAGLANVNLRTARSWLRCGVIRSSHPKMGNNLLFSFTDVFVGSVVSSLRHAGIDIDIVKRVADLLYSAGYDEDRQALAIIDGEPSMMTTAEFNRLKLRGVAVVGFSVIEAAQTLRDEIDRQIEQHQQGQAEMN